MLSDSCTLTSVSSSSPTASTSLFDSQVSAQLSSSIVTTPTFSTSRVNCVSIDDDHPSISEAEEMPLNPVASQVWDPLSVNDSHFVVTNVPSVEHNCADNTTLVDAPVRSQPYIRTSVVRQLNRSFSPVSDTNEEQNDVTLDEDLDPLGMLEASAKAATARRCSKRSSDVSAVKYANITATSTREHTSQLCDRRSSTTSDRYEKYYVPYCDNVSDSLNSLGSLDGIPGTKVVLRRKNRMHMTQSLPESSIIIETPVSSTPKAMSYPQANVVSPDIQYVPYSTVIGSSISNSTNSATLQQSVIISPNVGSFQTQNTNCQLPQSSINYVPHSPIDLLSVSVKNLEKPKVSEIPAFPPESIKVEPKVYPINVEVAEKNCSEKQNQDEMLPTLPCLVHVPSASVATETSEEMIDAVVSDIFESSNIKKSLPKSTESMENVSKGFNDNARTLDSPKSASRIEYVPYTPDVISNVAITSTPIDGDTTPHTKIIEKVNLNPSTFHSKHTSSIHYVPYVDSHLTPSKSQGNDQIQSSKTSYVSHIKVTETTCSTKTVSIPEKCESVTSESADSLREGKCVLQCDTSKSSSPIEHFKQIPMINTNVDGSKGNKALTCDAAEIVLNEDIIDHISSSPSNISSQLASDPINILEPAISFAVQPVISESEVKNYSDDNSNETDSALSQSENHSGTSSITLPSLCEKFEREPEGDVLPANIIDEFAALVSPDSQETHFTDRVDLVDETSSPASLVTSEVVELTNDNVVMTARQSHDEPQNKASSTPDVKCQSSRDCVKKFVSQPALQTKYSKVISSAISENDRIPENYVPFAKEDYGRMVVEERRASMITSFENQQPLLKRKRIVSRSISSSQPIELTKSKNLPSTIHYVPYARSDWEKIRQTEIYAKRKSLPNVIVSAEFIAKATLGTADQSVTDSVSKCFFLPMRVQFSGQLLIAMTLHLLLCVIDIFRRY